MLTPNIVILESRRFSDIADAWFNLCVEALNTHGLNYSRITVPNATDLPAALNILLHHTVKNSNGNFKAADGYIVLGYNYAGDISEHEHCIMLDSLSRIASTYPIAYSQLCVYEHDAAAISSALTQYVTQIKNTVMSLLNLLELNERLSSAAVGQSPLKMPIQGPNTIR